MKNTLYIWDIKHKIKQNSQIIEIINDITSNDKILSLTPISHFLFEKEKKKFTIFHDIISIVNFREKVLLKYKKIELLFQNDNFLAYLSHKFMQAVTYHTYIDCIEEYIHQYKAEYTIIYVTDTKNRRSTFQNLASNKTSLLHSSLLIDTVIEINNTDYWFYTIKNIKRRILTLVKYRNNITALFKKILHKYPTYAYDNQFFFKYFTYKKLDNIQPVFIDDHIETLRKKISDSFDGLLENTLLEILESFTTSINNFIIGNITYKPYSYLSNDIMFYETTLLKENRIPAIFFQHGNYLYPHVFFKHCEIEPASINFVLNDFTHKLFMDLGSKNVVTIGSFFFNFPIKEKKKIYDFLYITYVGNYSGNSLYIESKECLYSFDGFEIYQRHKAIIEFFGNNCKNKKICIKMHPANITYAHYVPLLELSQSYKNITIDFNSRITSLIEKSEYIISDYFSSEFLNRELHYKRDILLFQGAPLPLPTETLNDMKTMFILVDTIDDLKEKVNTIDTITKNRKRDDDIIEYYSSKKCNTKKIVTNILKEMKKG